MEIKLLYLDGSVITEDADKLDQVIQGMYGPFRLVSVSVGGMASKTQIYVEADEDGNIRPEIAAKVLFDALNRIN